MSIWGKSSTDRLCGFARQTARIWLLLPGFLIASLAPSATAQTPLDNARTDLGPQAELHMARVMHGAGMIQAVGWGRPMWAIDWPEAEAHITEGVQRMSLVDIYPDSRHVRLDDPNLNDYPWLFFQQPARGVFSQAEIAGLREYLLRGGFVLVDDFHGESERTYFAELARRLFPEHPLVPIPEDDPLMNIHYELNQQTQIPGERHLRRNASGETVAQMAGPQEWLGIYDSHGRLMLAAHFNMDMGDAWQHADDPWYPEPMTNLAYRFGVNYIIYAMTH